MAKTGISRASARSFSASTTTVTLLLLRFARTGHGHLLQVVDDDDRPALTAVDHRLDHLLDLCEVSVLARRTMEMESV
jgi:hypothetical protein